MIGPVFAALSVQHPSLVFLTVDVDTNEVRDTLIIQRQHVTTPYIATSTKGFPLQQLICRSAVVRRKLHGRSAVIGTYLYQSLASCRIYSRLHAFSRG